VDEERNIRMTIKGHGPSEITTLGGESISQGEKNSITRGEGETTRKRVHLPAGGDLQIKKKKGNPEKRVRLPTKGGIG